MDVLDVVLLETVTEALSVDIAESDALPLAEEVGVDVSEGDLLGRIEEETTADDDILADTDVLDVDEKLRSMEDVTDGVICNDAERSGDALLLSDIEDDKLANEDCDADADTLSEELAGGELDNVAMVVEVIDASGDVEEDADMVTSLDGVASALLEAVDIGEKLEDTEDEILDVSEGLFEEESDAVGVPLSEKNADALIEGGYVGSPVGKALKDIDTLDDDVVEGELDSVAMIVEVIELSGDVEAEEETETYCDGVASALNEEKDENETLEDELIQAEPDDVVSDEKETGGEILEVSDGLFVEETEAVCVALSDDNSVLVSFVDRDAVDNAVLLLVAVDEAVALSVAVAVDDAEEDAVALAEAVALAVAVSVSETKAENEGGCVGSPVGIAL